MNPSLIQYFQGFIDIFYPRICPVCGNFLLNNEELLCLTCFSDLPRTAFHQISDNEVARVFWGRVPLENATAFIFFSRDSQYRKILHALKYNGQKKIGVEMGRLFGLELRNTCFKNADVIIPVPLHPSKLRQRGYNQSELIARGISQSMNIPVESGLIVRSTPTLTQTKKSRYERWENVRDSFNVKMPDKLKNQHILLVDDVITTGATIEACASALISNSEGVRLSIACLACVKLQ